MTDRQDDIKRGRAALIEARAHLEKAGSVPMKVLLTNPGRVHSEVMAGVAATLDSLGCAFDALERAEGVGDA